MAIPFLFAHLRYVLPIVAAFVVLFIALLTPISSLFDSPQQDRLVCVLADETVPGAELGRASVEVWKCHPMRGQ